jgi:hypothetical protein
MTDPLSLIDVSNSGLRLLEYVASGEQIGREFWEGLRQACQDELAEREKPQRQKEILFCPAELPREDLAIVVNELRYLVSKLEAGDCPDDALVLLVASAGLVQEERLQERAAMN